MIISYSMVEKPLSKTLLARPVESRYGVGLSYVGTEGPYVLADDSHGVRYHYRLPHGIADVPAWYEANHRALVWQRHKSEAE